LKRNASDANHQSGIKDRPRIHKLKNLKKWGRKGSSAPTIELEKGRALVVCSVPFCKATPPGIRERKKTKKGEKVTTILSIHAGGTGTKR